MRRAAKRKTLYVIIQKITGEGPLEFERVKIYLNTRYIETYSDYLCTIDTLIPELDDLAVCPLGDHRHDDCRNSDTDPGHGHRGGDRSGTRPPSAHGDLRLVILQLIAGNRGTVTKSSRRSRSRWPAPTAQAQA